MTFHEKLKNLRVRERLSKKAAAELIGVSQQTYHSYETGKSMPKRKPEVLDKIAEVFACTKAYLLDDSADEAAAAEGEGARAAKRGRVKKTSPEVRMELQFSGRSVELESLKQRALEISGGADVVLYIKPEESLVYYVSGDQSGSFEM